MLRSSQPLTPKRPWGIFSQKLIFKKIVIDGNEDKIFGSQPYELSIDLL